MFFKQKHNNQSIKLKQADCRKIKQFSKLDPDQAKSQLDQDSFRTFLKLGFGRILIQAKNSCIRILGLVDHKKKAIRVSTILK